MTGDEFGGVVRAIAAPLVAFAAGKGWIGNDAVAMILTGLASLATAAWSVMAKRKA